MFPARKPSGIRETRIFAELDGLLPPSEYPNLNAFAKENPADFVIDDRSIGKRGIPRSRLPEIGRVIKELCAHRKVTCRYIWPSK